MYIYIYLYISIYIYIYIIYIYSRKKISARRRILLAKTYEQQTTQNTYKIVKVLETSIFEYIFEQKEQSVLPV